MVRYAPLTGAAQLRALLRARVIASREAGLHENRAQLLSTGRREGLELGGYHLGAALFGELQNAEPSGDAAATIAQADIGGAGLWLRTEPDHDPGQADRLAELLGEALSA